MTRAHLDHSAPSALSPASPVAASRDALLQLLDQLAALLGSVADKAYCAPAAHGGTVGAHARHVLDHVEQLLAGLEPAPTGSGPDAEPAALNYDARERNPLIECNPKLAGEHLAQLRRRLAAIPPEDGSLQLDAVVAADAPAVRVRTTRARELAFVGHHTVHHHAMIAAILATSGAPKQLPDGFGLAPATIQHQAARAAGEGGNEGTASCAPSH